MQYLLASHGFPLFFLGGNVVRGGVFSYTAPVYTVALEPSLLHALTLTGLETYTLRPHPFVVVSHLPEGLNMVVSIGKIRSHIHFGEPELFLNL